MPIVFQCECGHALSAKDEYAGRKTKCPSCGSIQQIPANDGAAAVKPKSGRSVAESGGQRAVATSGKPATKSSASKSGGKYAIDLDPADRPESGEIAAFARKGKLQAAPPPPRSGGGGNRSPSSSADTDGSRSTAAMQPVNSSPPPVALMLVGLTVVLAICGVAVLGILVMKGGSGGPAVAAAPVELKFASHYMGDVPLRFDFPEGWELKSGGGSGSTPPWAEFTHSGVKVRLRASQSGTAVMDLSGGAGAVDNNTPDALRPAAQVHAYQGETYYKTEYEKFVDQPSVRIDSKFGEGRISDFTASAGAFGGQVAGTRATVLTVTWQYNITMTAPPAKHAQYRPVIERMVKSLSSGM